eukprot:11909894-Prorocentrum_lima.AAC.1
MAQYGETVAGQTHYRCDIGRICPVRSILNELGMRLVWGSDRLILTGTSGKEILLEKNYGLPFVG